MGQTDTQTDRQTDRQIHADENNTSPKTKFLGEVTIEWHNQWALSDKGRVMFNFVTTPNKRDPINSLKRKEQVVIFRLRTNHIQLNSHLSRITKDHESSCPLCDYREETVNHFLFDCLPLQDLRKQYLPPFPNRENTLYSTSHQLVQTYRYYHEATRRRINIQVLLDL